VAAPFTGAKDFAGVKSPWEAGTPRPFEHRGLRLHCPSLILSVFSCAGRAERRGYRASAFLAILNEAPQASRL
jgi:hypothetical protein